MNKNLMPYELMHYEIADYEIDIWYYPIANAVEIYYNKQLFDTIPLDLYPEYKITWLEHKSLGRVQI